MINAHERDPLKYLQGMERAADAVSQGILDPTFLYTHTLPLDDVATGFELTHNRPDGFMKALIKI